MKLVIAAALLAGCATAKVEYVPFEVRVPVPVPCAAAVSDLPTEKLKKSDTLDSKTAALLADKRILEKAIEGCK